jgi:hypothetical protein
MSETKLTQPLATAADVLLTPEEVARRPLLSCEPVGLPAACWTIVGCLDTSYGCVLMVPTLKRRQELNVSTIVGGKNSPL